MLFPSSATYVESNPSSQVWKLFCRCSPATSVRLVTYTDEYPSVTIYARIHICHALIQNSVPVEFGRVLVGPSRVQALALTANRLPSLNRSALPNSPSQLTEPILLEGVGQKSA